MCLRIQKLLERFKELEKEVEALNDVRDKEAYRRIMQEYAYLSNVKGLWEKIERCQKTLEENRSLLLVESDPEFLGLIKDEVKSISASVVKLQAELDLLLTPPDPLDSRNILLEIRPGTGGDEAALFVGDCARMYRSYADKKGWSSETLSAIPSEKGGFKEYIMVISGHNVYRELKYEAGIHRVQRVPETEARGRIHTSAITVAVLLEPSEEEQVAIRIDDLKIDTFRASGAGGQHVNVTDSAVRLTHIPTGTTVVCQDERSQHKNKEKALRLLSARVANELRRKEQEEISSLRASQVGSGDRSGRIRTYNFSENRVTDHRISLTLYCLDEVLNGKLEELVAGAIAHFHQNEHFGK